MPRLPKLAQKETWLMTSHMNTLYFPKRDVLFPNHPFCWEVSVSKYRFWTSIFYEFSPWIRPLLQLHLFHISKTTPPDTISPLPCDHERKEKTNGFVYITSDLRNEWTADWRTWARSWKLWKLRPRRSWRTFPILQGRWLPRYADGWMKGRDDSGYRMLTWTCCKHTK